MLPSSGRRRPGARAIPDRVLIAVNASAPASAMARAIGRMSDTLGDSLTSSGRSVARRTAAVTSARGPAALDAIAGPHAVTERARRDEDRVGQHEAAAEIDRHLDVIRGHTAG